MASLHFTMHSTVMIRATSCYICGSKCHKFQVRTTEQQRKRRQSSRVLNVYFGKALNSFVSRTNDNMVASTPPSWKGGSPSPLSLPASPTPRDREVWVKSQLHSQELHTEAPPPQPRYFNSELTEVVEEEIADALLLDIYTKLYDDEPELQDYVSQEWRSEIEQVAKSKKLGQTQLVDRRAPINPLALKQERAKDPALRHNPLRGRLLAMCTTSAALLFVFLQTLGYSQVKTGWSLVSPGMNGMFGPSGEVLYELGGLNTNAIRYKKEHFRLFWAAWMHSGWIHIVFNVLSQIQFLFMYEPDWGFWRSLLLFWIAGVTGNLLSAVADPCTTTVGSSGGLFGLMGAMIPFCIEYWKTIPRPGCILGFTMAILIISILVGFTGNTDNWAHLGGLFGGTLFGLGTITNLSAFEKWVQEKKHPDRRMSGDYDKKRKKIIKKPPFTRFYQTHIQKGCKCGKREWLVRAISLALLISLWITCFVLLYHNFEFDPVGHITFTDTTQCRCCWVNLKAVPNPHLDDVPYYCFHTSFFIRRWNMGWEQFCNLSLLELEEIGPTLSEIDPIGRSIG